MDAFHMCLLLTAFCCGMLATSTWDFVYNASKWKCLIICVLLVSIVATCYAGAKIQSGQSFDQSLWQMLMERNPKTLIVAFAGLIFGASWGAMAAMAAMARQDSLKVLVSVITCMATLAAVSAGIVLAWDDAFDIERFQPTVLDSAYDIEELVQTEQMPIRLALDEYEEELYYSTYSTGVNGGYSGSIFSVPLSSQTTNTTPTLSASSPALYRTFGMTFHGGDLYVSRAGHAAQASHGSITYANMGAVTQLKDLDGDGQFEYFDDMIQGIPAARGPDTMHQNNGICFDTAGNLFVAVGSADDRSVDQHPWSGTILKQSGANGGPEVFARGLRNPFGICCGPAGSLFVTDNDCAEDPGDEVNLVTEGGHYGHPFAIPGERRATGFRDPILVGANSNYCGIAWLAGKESPEENGFVFVCDRLQNAIVRLKVSVINGNCTVIDNQVVAKVPTPVDIVISSNGDLYVASLLKQKIYRIRQQ